VGLFSIQSALLLGRHRVIAIDHHPRRLELARQLGAEIIDFEQVTVREALAEMTAGIGPTPASMPWAWRAMACRPTTCWTT
jgi:threonine dehydrogenase-like Zn-dependent dehydrogenase